MSATPQEIHEFYEKYRINNSALQAKTKELYTSDLDIHDWIDKLRERSSLAKKVFLDNEKMIDTVIKPFAEDPSLLDKDTVEAFIREITPLVSCSHPDYVITEYILEAILTFMKDNHYSSLEISQVNNNLMLSKINTKRPIRNFNDIPGLTKILRYIDTNAGTESLVHIQNLVLMITVKNRIYTYIHSVIVSKLSTLIARALLANHPDFFEGIAENPADILGFINAAALLHDIGKTDLAHLIDTETREITEVERTIIRTHADLGGNLLESVAVLAPFADIARGHHVFYDGSSGYPEAFDVKSSKYRNVISLISICDSIDAGTDDIGRNYVEAKPLSSILDELKAGSGTRYDPVIVAEITDNEMIIDQINDIVTVGRENVCYDVYHQYLES